MAIVCVVCIGHLARAQTVAPGDYGQRYDLQLLADQGAINIPLTTWPVSRQDINAALEQVDVAALDDLSLAAFARLRRPVTGTKISRSPKLATSISAAMTPVVIRTFEHTPRDEGRLAVALLAGGERVTARLNIAVIANPDDGERLRLDGTAVGATVGNWILSAGWQERWWGPGNAGSLILSSNARPVPALSLQRVKSDAFEPRFLKWLGPWTFAGFAGQLTDERAVDNALLIGARFAFKPVSSLEIGLSRSAQFCGSGRPCGGSTWLNVLLGRDNRGVNVDVDQEPGNQLAGFDARWRLPGKLRLAAYLQWIAEDTRRGGPELGSWLRLAGLEHWGTLGKTQHRSYVELADTSCRTGGIGFSDSSPDCGYENGIYRTGYRHYGRSIGHGIDGDGLSYAIGSTVIQAAGQRWTAVARYVEINRIGEISTTHTLSPVPAERIDVLLTHERPIARGTVVAGVGWSAQDATSVTNRVSDPVVFLEWRSDLRD